MSYHEISTKIRWLACCHDCQFSVYGNSAGAVEKAAREHIEWFNEDRGESPYDGHTVEITSHTIMGRF